MMKKKNLTEKEKKNTVWVVILSVLSLVVTVQLLTSNYLAGKGERLASLEKKASALERENRELQEELSQKSSLTKLAVDAQSSGFAKPENILYLDTSLPVAALLQ